ncbi:ankyrin repeat domain-containing protein 1-like isoform X3 [Haliotis rubra]|uniref:ankyrin repeat domain-containing protein 1-like isoform X3 n=1 Tax=Haliotis rubra TaxID=36100 RepID=UPI001EE57ADC|nr:ankyrin repeat domain-containing protein 1-like isoform X3 [Haliotis rubra]
MDSKIKDLENDIKNKAKLEDAPNVQDQIGELKEKINFHKSEIERLETKVLPDLMAEIKLVTEQLGEHERTAKGKLDDVPVLKEKLQRLTEKVDTYGTDVARERETVADIYAKIGKLEKDFKKKELDKKRAEETFSRELETMKAEQLKQSRQGRLLQDTVRELQVHQTQMAKHYDNTLKKVQDQLKEEKMAREAAERKVNALKYRIQALEKPDAGHMETSQVSGDFKTGVYQQAGDEAEQHGVTQKDSNPRHVDALLDACCDGDMAEVKRVLDLGQVDVNYRGGRSLTPVMMAALGGYREMVELLLSRGADVSLVDVVGNNTLHWACVGGDVGTVELILSQDGVDVNARNNDGETAADVASGRGHQLVDLVSRAAR